LCTGSGALFHRDWALSRIAKGDLRAARFKFSAYACRGPGTRRRNGANEMPACAEVRRNVQIVENCGGSLQRPGKSPQIYRNTDSVSRGVKYLHFFRFSVFILFIFITLEEISGIPKRHLRGVKGHLMALYLCFYCSFLPCASEKQGRRECPARPTEPQILVAKRNFFGTGHYGADAQRDKISIFA
jgi:hypothetical protein